MTNPTKDNGLRLTLVGGPTVLIEYQGLRLLTDPTFDPAGRDYVTGPVVLTKTAGPVVSPQALGRVDAVLLSHDQHADNLDEAGRAMLASVGRVLTTPEGAGRLGGNAVGLAPWQSIDLAAPDGRALRVTGTPARHGPEGIEPVAGPVTGFVLAPGDGTGDAVYVSGDTVWFDGVAEVARRYPVRTAVLFLGGARLAVVGGFHLTMTAEEAVTAARAFSEAVIVPAHADGWAHFTEGRAEVDRAFAEAGLASRLRWLVPSEPTELGE
jgi:L-ascorbate metabolism protein UlaG (beta-lactamase superfamily)